MGDAEVALIPASLQAGLWGLFAGGALVLGAGIAWFVDVPQRVISAVMSFGAGVLISALSFELMDEAWRHGELAATTAVAAGAILAMLADTMIPEAYESAHEAAGLITVLGFLASFMLTKLGG